MTLEIASLLAGLRSDLELGLSGLILIFCTDYCEASDIAGSFDSPILLRDAVRKVEPVLIPEGFLVVVAFNRFTFVVLKPVSPSLD